MKHRASPAFWSLYNSLPPEIRRTADRSYEHLKHDPSHPSLHFKKLGRFWSARVGLHHRALAVESGEDLIWFWIGTHADYDKEPDNLALQRSSAQMNKKSAPAAEAAC